ncbi:hypothetical protein BGZ80_005592, partial [Entomortierella chlamydospora]
RTLSNGSSTAVSPRRAKVSSLAQMDISSVPYSPKSNPGSAPVASTNSSRGPSATYNSTNTNAPVRAPSVKVRTSNSVTATSPSRNPSGGGSTISSSRKDSGSVTSDDGTISEDSDLTRDEMLFTGGQANVGGGITLPFGTSKRPASIGGPVYGVGIKLGATTVSGGNGLSRHRSSSSIIGLSSGSIISGITPKPMRMAAGATIKIDSPNNHSGNYTSISSSHSSLGLSSAPGSTVGSQMSPNTTGLTSSATMPIWSTPSSPSLSRNGSFRRSGGGGGDDGSSTISVNSTNPHHPNVRSNKNIGSANIKQTEESRRNEEAARTRRKIQDLEISNSSLLNLNQSLETTNRKLVAEIQELKTRIQS